MAGVAPIAKAAKTSKTASAAPKHRASEPPKPKSVQEFHPGESTRKPSEKKSNPVASKVKRNFSLWGSPNSYTVRRAHNLLIVMWMVGTVIILSEFLANQNPVKVWKQLFAFQLVIFLLSLFVLIDSIANLVAGFAVLIVLGLALVPGHIDNIVGFISRFGNLAPPVAPAKGPVEPTQAVNYTHIQTLVPRNTGSVASTAPPPAPTPSSTPPEWT